MEMPDVNSVLASRYQEMFDFRSCVKNLAIQQDAHFQHLFENLRNFQQEIAIKVQDVEIKQEEFFQTVFKEHKEMDKIGASIKYELEDFKTKQRGFLLELSAEQQTRLSLLKRISTEMEDTASKQKDLFQEATTENRDAWKMYQEKLVGFKKSTNAEILVLTQKQEELNTLFDQQQLQIYKQHANLVGEIETVINKLEDLIHRTSTGRQEMNSEQNKQLKELQENLNRELKDLTKKQLAIFQEYSEQFKQLVSIQHSYNSDLQGIAENQRKIQAQVALLVSRQVDLSFGITSLTDTNQKQIDQHTDRHGSLISELKDVSQMVKKYEENQEKLLAVQNNLSCELKVFSEKQSQKVDRIQSSQNHIAEQQLVKLQDVSEKQQSQLSQQEEMFNFFQNVLTDQLINLRNDMRSELSAVSKKLCEQDVMFTTLSEKLLYEQDKKIMSVFEEMCQQKENFKSIEKILTEKLQQQLGNFGCEIKDYSEKQQLQVSQQAEKLHFAQNTLAEQLQLQVSQLPETLHTIQNTLAEQQKQIPLKTDKLCENQQKQLSQQETIPKVAPNVFAEQIILSSELKVFSEKQESEISQTIAERYQAELKEFRDETEVFRNERVDSQGETDIQLKELSNQIQKSVSAIQKKLEGVEEIVRGLIESSVLKSKPSTASQNEYPRISSVGQGNLFMGDVVVGGDVIGKIDMREVYQKKKTLQQIQIKNIDYWKITVLQKEYENQKASVMVQESMKDNPGIMHQVKMSDLPESMSTMSLKTKEELQSSKSHTGPVTKPLTNEGMTKETIVVLGGYESKGVIESFNAASNIWTTHEDISDRPTGETLGVTVGDVIIIFERDNERTRSLEFSSKRWTELESPPVYRYGLRAAVDGNLVYLTGGHEHLTRCDVYDFQSNQWSEGPYLNVGRRYHGSATLAGKIYCCGGRDGKWTDMASTEVLDPGKEGNGRWISVADMKVERSELGLASCSRFLWAVGGTGGSTRLTDLERYDPVSDIWTKVADMMGGRKHPSVCFFLGKLYAIGGQNSEALNTVQAYDPEKNEWTDVAPLNQKRSAHAPCPLNLYSGS